MSLSDHFIEKDYKMIPDVEQDVKDSTRKILDTSFQGVKNIYHLIVVDLSKQQNALDADPSAIPIQHILFTDVKSKSRLYHILEESKETILEFYKGTGKVLQAYCLSG